MTRTKKPVTRKPTEIDRDILMLHDEGHTCSEIDLKLELAPGTAHDATVNLWTLDKQCEVRMRTVWADKHDSGELIARFGA